MNKNEHRDRGGVANQLQEPDRSRFDSAKAKRDGRSEARTQDLGFIRPTL